MSSVKVVQSLHDCLLIFSSSCPSVCAISFQYTSDLEWLPVIVLVFEQVLKLGRWYLESL